MKRRDILKYTAIATGAVLSAPLISSLSSCQNEVAARQSFKPSFFSQEEFNFLEEIVDVILPQTNSPSASELGVHQTIDQMLDQVYEEEDKKKYRSNFKSLYVHFQQGIAIDEEQVASLENHSEEDVKEAFLALKQQTIAYYLSTEEVGKNFLNYLPLPGEYEGCIALADVGGKAWAL